MTLVTSSLQDAPCNGIHAGVLMGSIPMRFRQFANSAGYNPLQIRYKGSVTRPPDYEPSGLAMGAPCDHLHKS